MKGVGGGGAGGGVEGGRIWEAETERCRRHCQSVMGWGCDLLQGSYYNYTWRRNIYIS